ncbi:glycoside hydrolase family 73 protein [Aurantibacillus circumpalustris]|uniref:glycoside hydrolase family 73 protein n=1 Tax=Aurantibacillus circumpalustris TaxID=3036359 RepID=UPI00295C1DD9|nr:glucosaminidase domain-containing protein [Aurantibacillus circumpalustris]
MIKARFSIAESSQRFSLSLSVFLILFSFTAFAQPPQFKIYTYIEKYKDVAVHQMVEYKIPASVILAQAICESSSGTSELAKKSNNHFGIKCHVGWVGDTIARHDDTLNECFRSYKNIEQSYTDHSLFLVTRPRYAELFKLSVIDYKNWCLGLKTAGYATAPHYATRLIQLIEELKLYELDGFESLTTEVRRLEKDPEIKVSKYTGLGFSVRDFSRAGFLWADAKDVSMRSLDFVVQKQNGVCSEVAGN